MEMMRTECDCMRCCVAEVLNMPYCEVPEFTTHKEQPYAEYKKKLEQFIKEMNLICITVSVDPKYEIPFQIEENFKFIGSLHKEGRSYAHAVVLETRKENGKIEVYLRDPKPNSEYTIKDLEQIEFFIPKENK